MSIERSVIVTPAFRKQSAFVEKIADVIELGYIKNVKSDDFKQKHTFSPSSIGYGHGTCPRYWFYALNGANFQDTVNARGVANMSYGTSAHERIQKIFKESGILVSEEEEILLSDPPIRGFIDLVIDVDGEIAPGEIKTARQESWEIRLSSGKPIDYHLVQILIYMYAKQSKKGFFLYENKNTQEILLIEVELTEKNQELLDRILNWLRKVYANYEADVLPERPFTKKSKQCKFCPLSDTCWKDKDGDVKIEKLDISV